MPRRVASKARGWSRCGDATTATASAASALRVALRRRRRPRRCSSTRCPTQTRTYPDLARDLSRREPHAARGVRSPRHRIGRRRSAAVAVACELADRPLSAAPRFRGARRSGSRARRTIRSCASRATACTRSRSGPCTPASSSRAISASRSSAKKCCGWKSGSATSHKGIEKRFEAMPLADGHRLAGRVSGDSTVAYAWAYAQALEAIAGVHASRRARCGCARWRSSASASPIIWAISAISATTAASRSASRSSRGSRRTCCARTSRAFGHRLLMDYVVPGGVARDLDARRARPRCATSATTLEREIRVLRDIYDEHAGLQDRFRGCGLVTPALAREARPHRPRRPRQRPGVRPALRLPGGALRRARRAQGDADATATSPRASRVRFDELAESLRLVARDRRRAARRRHCASPLPRAAARIGSASGYVEGWRGPVLVALESGPDGTIRRCHPHDPSWHELAGARARGDRQHRSRLSADQQVVQPFVQRTRPLGPPMLHILRQIAKTGIKTERAAGARRRAW